jgi:hypothetical protein
MIAEPVILEYNTPRRCEQFYLCENMTLQGIEHPILGYVPTCTRCRDKIQRLRP